MYNSYLGLNVGLPTEILMQFSQKFIFDGLCLLQIPLLLNRESAAMH